MTNMKAAEKAAELANAINGADNWNAGDFLIGLSDTRAFVQFIADADAAARKAIDAMKANPASDALSIAERVFSPFILPDDVDPLAEMKGVADFLTEQRDEPYPDTYAKRFHYWRDKAITAAGRLEAIRTELEARK